MYYVQQSSYLVTDKWIYNSYTFNIYMYVDFIKKETFHKNS